MATSDQNPYQSPHTTTFTVKTSDKSLVGWKRLFWIGAIIGAGAFFVAVSSAGVMFNPSRTASEQFFASTIMFAAVAISFIGCMVTIVSCFIQSVVVARRSKAASRP
jgi:mannose/fructose/N-acetylgalactosamine-specific phosphotransferase system component IIC